MDERQYLSVEEYSQRSGLAVITVRRYIRSGRLRALQPGGRKHRILIPVAALEQVLTPAAPESIPLAKPKIQKPLPGPIPNWRKGPQPQYPS